MTSQEARSRYHVVMNTTIKTLGLGLISLLVVPALVGQAMAATPPALPEYGFRGVKRVEIVLVNAGQSGFSGGIAPQPDGAAPGQPADDLATKELSKDSECQAIGKTLSNAGLEIVERCKSDDFTCAQLYLIVENHSRDGNADRIYLAGAELSQRVRLARDKKVELAMPSTWSAHRVAVVPADHSATASACIELRALATWFGSTWRVANR